MLYRELATHIECAHRPERGRVDLDFLTGALLVSPGSGMPSGTLILPVGTCATVPNIRPATCRGPVNRLHIPVDVNGIFELTVDLIQQTSMLL